jgi:glycosyltransferase involved in cell wall biosynthesis
MSKYFDGYCTHSIVIGNGIPDFYLNVTKSSHFTGNWAFVAVFERGLTESAKAFVKVKEKCDKCARNFTFSSYYLADGRKFGDLIDNRLKSKNYMMPGRHDNEMYIYDKRVFSYTGSLSRLEVSNLLSRSEYLIYPLVLENGLLHLDTFATSVLEAVAHGVIVIVWDLACFAEVRTINMKLSYYSIIGYII